MRLWDHIKGPLLFGIGSAIMAGGFALLIFAAVTAANAANNQTPPPDGPLFDYQVKTLRAQRVEICDDTGRIRMVLGVYDGVPIVAVYDEAGEPVKLVTVDLR